MPMRKGKLSREDSEIYRLSNSELRKMGFPMVSTTAPGMSLSSPTDPKAHVLDVPSGRLAVILPAEITALRRGVRITKCDITLPWEGAHFDIEEILEDFDEHLWYSLLQSFSRFSPADLLNPWVSGQLRLPEEKLRGVIIAFAWFLVPPQYPIEMSVPVKLMIRDNTETEYYLDYNPPRSLRLHPPQMRRVSDPQRKGLLGSNGQKGYGRPPAENRKPVVSDFGSDILEHPEDKARKVF